MKLKLVRSGFMFSKYYWSIFGYKSINFSQTATEYEAQLKTACLVGIGHSESQATCIICNRMGVVQK